MSFIDSPQIKPIPEQTIKEGEDITLHCSAESNPSPNANSYSWRDQTGKEYTTQNLTIEGVNKNHTGNYTCTVRVNSEVGYGILTGETTTRITLQCKYINAMKILGNIPAPSFELLTEGDTLLIECMSNGEPTPLFTPGFIQGCLYQDGHSLQ